MRVCLNENKAEPLTVADFCSAAQVEFPIREDTLGKCTKTLQSSRSPRLQHALPSFPYMGPSYASTTHVCTDK